MPPRREDQALAALRAAARELHEPHDVSRALALVSTSDLQLVASLIVQTVIVATELMLDTDPDDADQLARISDDAARQLHMVLVGVGDWRSGR